jgi:hypothetical protein
VFESSASDLAWFKEESVALTEREKAARQALQVAYNAARSARDEADRAEKRADRQERPDRGTRAAGLRASPPIPRKRQAQSAAVQEELAGLPELQDRCATGPASCARSWPSAAPG